MFYQQVYNSTEPSIIQILIKLIILTNSDQREVTKRMLPSNFTKMDFAFHFQTSAVAQQKLRPNKINWTHNYNNKFTFLRFLYSHQGVLR
jgi:hypothetical protein